MSEKKYILNKEVAEHKLHRMALELAEQLNGDAEPVYILGIVAQGMIIAEKIAAVLKQYVQNPVEIFSITMNKDKPTDVVLSGELPKQGGHIIIVDDVTNSGKTLLYALKPILDHYPTSIRTLVLVERMHKMYPIQPDFVGLSLSTTLEEHIQVEVVNGSIEGVYVS